MSRWLLKGCAALSLVVVVQSVHADDLQDASQMLRAGQHQQALERINRVLAAKPRDAQARFLKGLILTEQGNSKEAIAIFQNLTKDYPDLPEPYNNLAVIYAAQGQYDKARGSLEQSIRTHPSYATAYENLGDVYSKLASQAYDKALQLDSSNSTAQNKLALVRELVGGTPRSPAAASRTPASLKPTVVAAASEAKPAVTQTTPVVAEAKPAAAKGADKPALEKAPVASNEDLMRTVNSWAGAWSKKNVDAYLSYYAKDFKTPNGESRGNWEKGRRARLMAPKFISVVIDNPQVSLSGDASAKVTFLQHYKSDTLSVNSHKTLVLVKSGADWRIQQERSSN